MKIFELAKELDMGAIDLVEKLKDDGFSVRNHMSSLSDDEVVKVRLSFEEEAKLAKPAAKKKTKKKAAKKKVAKKKVSTVKSAAATDDDATTVKATKKKVVIKRSTVIRKKGDGATEELAASEGDSSVVVEEKAETLSATLSQSLTQSLGEDPNASSESEYSPSSGLRVVSRPEVKKADEPVIAEKEGDKQTPIYKEKVHTFTPVFIPEKKEAAESEKDEKSTTTSAATGEDQKDKDSKKRLGGLATLMSGKKGVVSKSQTLNIARSENELKSYAALSGSGRPIYTQVKRKKIFSGAKKGTEITEVKDSKRVVKLHDGALAVELAKKLKIKLKEMIDQCLDMNLLVKGDDYIGMSLAAEIADLFSYRVENVSFDEEAAIGKEELSEEQIEKLPLRDPIITIMGHVDHGKTTLLDYIRNAKVASGEAGGITQHIGAYSVTTNSGKKLTFLDTPGHAAFGAMRQRGADATDIVILVVAADDGVMPQTKESVRFIQNSNAPMIVAINKMDKEGVNPDRIKNELAEFNITPEEWGGDTQMIPISALKGDGVDDLLEAIALQAEILELRADAKGNAEGVIIESYVETGRGPVATILVEAGTLKTGDSVVAGECYGRARSLTDHLGKQMKSAGPSTPVQILGLDNAPSPGDTLNVVKSEREAKKIVQNRIDERKRLEVMPVKASVSLEDFFGSAVEDNVEAKTLNIIVRTDVQGSFEAIKNALMTLSNTEVEVRVLGGGVGPISDSDVELATASNGIIMGFNMRPLTSARKIAEDRGVEIRTYTIIYELINDVTMALEGMLDPEFIEKYIGRVEVKETFVVPKAGTIAGSVVIDGAIQVGCQVRLLREGKIIFDGKMSSLRRFKDDVKEVKSGYECGVGLEGYDDVKVGDLFEAYLMEEKKRTLEDVAKTEGNESLGEATL
jgi:translation initiation factor IF-2